MSPLELSLLKSKRLQLFQYLLAAGVSSSCFYGPPLIGGLSVTVRAPGWNTADGASQEGITSSDQLATLLNAAEDMVVLPGFKHSLPAHF